MFHPLPPLCHLLRCDVGLVKGNVNRNVAMLQYCVSSATLKSLECRVITTFILNNNNNYYYNGAQWSEQFLQVGQLYRALILFDLALCLLSTSVSSAFMMLYIFHLLLHSLLHFSESRAWWDWPLPSLTCPSAVTLLVGSCDL